MKTKSLKDKTKDLYQNTKEIILFFEEQFAANLVWYKRGNLMFLDRTDKNVCVFYDEAVFKKI